MDRQIPLRLGDRWILGLGFSEEHVGFLARTVEHRRRLILGPPLLRTPQSDECGRSMDVTEASRRIGRKEGVEISDNEVPTFFIIATGLHNA